jgi:hypothetical protein
MKTNLLLYPVLLFLGCTVPYYNPSHPSLKENGNSCIIVLRPSAALGDSVKTISILLNNKFVARLQPGAYCHLRMDAGTYEIQIGDGDPVQMKLLPQKLPLTLAAQEDKYIELVPETTPGYGTQYLIFKPVIIDAETALRKLAVLNKIN